MANDENPVTKPVKITDVAVGVLQKPDGSVLYAQRPSGKVYEGWWEFPGGKRERGEPIEQTLVRELREELGITVTQFAPWVVRDHVYPHATVQLHFFKVTQWLGEPASSEGQALLWQDRSAAPPQPLLPAAIAVIDWLVLPNRYVRTSAGTLGIVGAVNAIGNQIKLGACLVHLFEPLLSNTEVIELYNLLCTQLPQNAAGRLLVNRLLVNRILVNRNHQHLIDRGATGIHLNSENLMVCQRKPQVPLVGADCETVEQLAHAATLGLDFVVMPVDFFIQAARISRLPVFAWPQLDSYPFDKLLSTGAHGICIHAL